jgi:carboxymethylenebutenolidase
LRTTIATPDGDMELSVAGDPASPSGAVVVIQEAFGLTAHIERCVQRMADAGFYAVAPALFHRTTAESFAYDNFDAIRSHMEALSAEGITTDLSATVGHLDELGFGVARRGIIGFCMGGSVALVAGTLGEFGAAVTFYGGGVTTGRFGFAPLVELAPKLTCPWLGCFGDLDKGIAVDDVEQLRAAAARAKVETEVVRYADADHGFNCEDRPAVYNEKAAADAWAHSVAFFTAHLAVRA